MGLKKIYFIQNFLSILEMQHAKMFVIDEAGFGSKPLRNYGYAICGKPAHLKTKTLGKNISCIATIS